MERDIFGGVKSIVSGVTQFARQKLESLLHDPRRGVGLVIIETSGAREDTFDVEPMIAGACSVAWSQYLVTDCGSGFISRIRIATQSRDRPGAANFPCRPPTLKSNPSPTCHECEAQICSVRVDK